MKNIFKTGALALTALFSLAACSTSTIVKMSFTDYDSYAETALPNNTVFGGSQGYAMMQIQKIDIEITLKSDSYIYSIANRGIEAPDPMAYLETYEYTGALSLADGVYSFAAPDHVTRVLSYGDSFAEYSAIFGEQGTFTDDAKDLAKFTPCTAIMEGDSLIFVIPE